MIMKFVNIGLYEMFNMIKLKYIILITSIIVISSCTTTRIDYSELPNLIKEFEYTTVYYNKKNKERAILVGEAFDFGYTYLINNEFKEYPLSRIKTYVYLTQGKMMGGVVLYGGWSEEQVLLFRKGGSPVPINNTLHVGPSFPLSGVVHELVHAFIKERFNSSSSTIKPLNETVAESNYRIKNEGFINSHLKWLDEGLADYFTHKIMLNHIYISESQRKSQREYYDHFHKLKKENRIISLSEIETISQWVNRIIEGDAIIIYPECFIIVTYLVSNYGINKVFDIFKEVEMGLSVTEAFVKIFKKTEEDIMQDIFQASIEQIFGELYLIED